MALNVTPGERRRQPRPCSPACGPLSGPHPLPQRRALLRRLHSTPGRSPGDTALRRELSRQPQLLPVGPAHPRSAASFGSRCAVAPACPSGPRPAAWPQPWSFVTQLKVQLQAIPGHLRASPAGHQCEPYHLQAAPVACASHPALQEGWPGLLRPLLTPPRPHFLVTFPAGHAAQCGALPWHRGPLRPTRVDSRRSAHIQTGHQCLGGGSSRCIAQGQPRCMSAHSARDGRAEGGAPSGVAPPGRSAAPLPETWPGAALARLPLHPLPER